MLDNPIERSSKAWGLGQNAKICFSPRRGARFSIKCGQNTGLEGVFYEGVGLPAARAWPQVPCFFRLFCVTSILYRFLSKKCPKKCENQGFWALKTNPKPSQNRLKIDVPQNMHLFNASWMFFFFTDIFNFLKICILPR